MSQPKKCPACYGTVEGSTLTWMQWKRKYGLRAVKVVVEVLRPIGVFSDEPNQNKT